MYKIENNHLLQKGAKKCTLYSIANAIGCDSFLNELSIVDETGGANFHDANKILINSYSLQLMPIYFSLSADVPIKDKRVFFNDELFKDAAPAYYVPMVFGRKGKGVGLNHAHALFYFPFYKKFVLIDSLDSDVLIFDDLDVIFTAYDIYEWYYISDLNKATGFLATKNIYAEDILNHLSKLV